MKVSILKSIEEKLNQKAINGETWKASILTKTDDSNDSLFVSFKSSDAEGNEKTFAGVDENSDGNINMEIYPAEEGVVAVSVKFNKFPENAVELISDYIILVAHSPQYSTIRRNTDMIISRFEKFDRLKDAKDRLINSFTIIDGELCSVTKFEEEKDLKADNKVSKYILVQFKITTNTDISKSSIHVEFIVKDSNDVELKTYSLDGEGDVDEITGTYNYIVSSICLMFPELSNYCHIV